MLGLTSTMPRVLFVLGTRPEAIKLAPVILHMAEQRHGLDIRVCVTGQHRELLDDVLTWFSVKPDYDLAVMRPGQSLFESTSTILKALEGVLADRFDFIVVQGDTTTTLCGALAGFYARIPVGHVEAGLRTGNLDHPFPEEMNRIITTRLASLHFAATSWAAENLLREGVDGASIQVTGNPVTDAIRRVHAEFRPGTGDWDYVDPNKRLVLVTAHRRESFGEPFDRICTAIRRIAALPDVQIVYPVHPNPTVRAQTRSRLDGIANIKLIDPLGYAPFVDLMAKSYLLLTDSGGVQEEAPTLGKPVLVLRETTERREAVEAGTAILVGTDVDTIFNSAHRLLTDPEAYSEMARRHNPYGDGYASERIASAIREYLLAV